MYEKEDVYLEEHMKNKELTSENSKLQLELAESEVSRARRRSIYYVIGIIGMYILYRIFIVNGTSLKTCGWYWIIDTTYWLLTTIVLNVVNHKICIEGILSFFSKKYKQKMISSFLDKMSSTNKMANNDSETNALVS